MRSSRRLVVSAHYPTASLTHNSYFHLRSLQFQLKNCHHEVHQHHQDCRFSGLPLCFGQLVREQSQYQKGTTNTSSAPSLPPPDLSNATSISGAFLPYTGNHKLNITVWHGDPTDDSKIFGRGQGGCGETEWIPEGSDGSPLIRDCLEMIERQTIAWHRLVMLEPRRTLISHGTCAFGAQMLTFNGGATSGEGIPLWWTNIDSDDIWDLTRDAVDKFRWNDKMGGRGILECDDSLVDWAIYRA